ncbi:YcaO-like family protein [Rhizobium giardinii]|uniref:Ribosomal protein S12 methylthiotransferase accessory factor n=1 Tax=Rhizobium giardinii TaxID=56731 RepID=A0A7W8U8X9_9HYPH|nr:ribosomal protein S12 methylthiotransferase accessory factor [Rhizobium giardinii]
MGETALSSYCDRVIAPEETLARIKPFLCRFGVTRLGRLTGLDNIGIPVWNAVSPNARSIVINQGKGITDIDAKVSAAMEALERAVACEPCIATRCASRDAMLAAGEQAIPLHALTAHGFADLDDSEEVRWASGHDLLKDETAWVPLDAASLDRTRDDCRYWQSSDGLASGNTQTEATLHGTLERIERDAEVLWRMMPLAKRLQTFLDHAAFGDAVLSDVVGRIIDAGLTLRLFDITSDIAVPCYTALLAPKDILSMKQPLYHQATIGHGCHPNPVRAAVRAITEVAQSRLTYISGARDDVFPETFTRPLAEETRVLFTATAAPRAVARPPVAEGPDALLAHVLRRLSDAHIKTAVALPLLHGDFPFSVVKVFLPQLENPDGLRKRRLGPRAVARMLETA